MEPASKHLLTNLSIDKEARLEFPTTLFPSTFNILEVKKTINSTLTWDPILGPFFISSLTAIAQNELTAKIKKYCTCFFDMCCSPQQEAIEQQNIEAQLDRNDNILKDIDISLNSHNKGLPSSFFPVEVINSAKKSIEVEPQAILNAYKQYFLFRQRFPNEETWKKAGQAIEENNQIPIEDRILKKNRLIRFRLDCCSEEAIHFAHYSTPALNKACEIFLSIREIITKARESLGMNAELDDEAPIDDVKEGANIQKEVPVKADEKTLFEKEVIEPIKKGTIILYKNVEKKIVHQYRVLTDTVDKVKFQSKYQEHLNEFSRSLKKEQAKLCKALEARLWMAHFTELSDGDFIHFIVQKLNSFGIKSSQKIFTGAKQTDAEWDVLCENYMKLGGLRLEEIICTKVRRETLSSHCRFFLHPKGLVSTMIVGGSESKDLKFRGASPAFLTRYHYFLRYWSYSHEEASIAEWIPFLNLVVFELQRLPLLDIKNKRVENDLIYDWKEFWIHRIPIILFEFKSFLDKFDFKRRETFYIRENSLTTLALLGYLTHFLLEYKLSHENKQVLDGLIAKKDPTPEDNEKIIELKQKHEIRFEDDKLLIYLLAEKFDDLYKTAIDCFLEQLYKKNKDKDQILLVVGRIIEIVTGSIVKKQCEVFKSAVEHKAPVPSCSEILDFFKGLKRKSIYLDLCHFLEIISADVHSLKDGYLTLMQDLEKFLIMQDPDFEKKSFCKQWLKTYESKIKKTQTQILSNFNNHVFTNFKTNELNEFCEVLNEFPELKKQFIRDLKKYLVDKFLINDCQNNLLTKFLVKLDDKVCIDLFLDKFLEKSPSLEIFEKTTSILQPVFVKFPECQQKVKVWLVGLFASPAPFPNPYVTDKLLQSLKNGFTEELKEEILYAMDQRCQKWLKQNIPTQAGRSCSLHELHVFLGQFQEYSFAHSEKGKVAYFAYLESFPPTAWNPLVWDVVTRWGPVKMQQKWRLIWLRVFEANKETSPGEAFPLPSVIFDKKVEHKGHAGLRELFGRENLKEVLSLLSKCCANGVKPTKSLMLLWRELDFCLIEETDPTAVRELRDGILGRNYNLIFDAYRANIRPLQEHSREFLNFLAGQRWKECLTDLMNVLETTEETTLRGLLWHVENAIAGMFVKTEQEQRENLQKDIEVFKKNFLDPLAIAPIKSEFKKIHTQFIQKMKEICENFESLHKFCLDFTTLPNEEWLVKFEKGVWTKCFDLLNERLRAACLMRLNHHLPLCTTAASFIAWLNAVKLLQSHSACPREAKQKIEQTRIDADPTDLPQPLSDEQIWRKQLKNILPHPKINEQPSCYSLTQGPCRMDSGLAQIINPDGTCNLKIKEGNSHPVDRFSKLGKFDVFFKWRPHAFGIQLIDHFLFRFVLGGLTPFVDLVKVIGSNGFFQLSETIPGECLGDLLKDQTAPVPKIDPESYSENFIRMLLDCEWDGKSENYQATEIEGTDTIKLTMLDNELALNPPYRFEKKENEIKLEILMKSILPCFDQVREKLNENVANRLRKLDICAALQQVLIASKQARRRLISCIEEKEESQAWESADPRYLSISIQQRNLEHWYTTLWKIKGLLEKPELPTHLELLEILFPPIAQVLANAHSHHSHPEERFLFMHRQNYTVVTLIKDGHPRRTLLTIHSRQVLQLCLGNDQETFGNDSPSLTIDDALYELQKLDQQTQRIVQIRQELQNGNFAPFLEIKAQTIREDVLWGANGIEGLKWDQLSEVDQKHLLESIKNYSFKQLHLAYCCALTKKILKTLVENSPGLEVLILRGNKNIIFSILKSYSKFVNLRKLDLSETSIFGLHGNYPNLVELKADKSKLLSLGPLVAPLLRFISVEHCYFLEKLDLQPHSTCIINGSNCRLEAARQMGLIHFYENRILGQFPSNTVAGGETIFNKCVEMQMIDQANYFANLVKIKHLKWLPGLKGRSPLHVAVHTNNFVMIGVLSDYKEFDYALDDLNHTPFMTAAVINSHAGIYFLFDSALANLPWSIHSIVTSSIGAVGNYCGLLPSNMYQKYRLSSTNILFNGLILALENKRNTVIAYICQLIISKNVLDKIPWLKGFFILNDLFNFDNPRILSYLMLANLIDFKGFMDYLLTINARKLAISFKNNTLINEDLNYIKTNFDIFIRNLLKQEYLSKNEMVIKKENSLEDVLEKYEIFLNLISIQLILVVNLNIDDPSKKLVDSEIKALYTKTEKYHAKLHKLIANFETNILEIEIDKLELNNIDLDHKELDTENENINFESESNNSNKKITMEEMNYVYSLLAISQNKSALVANIIELINAKIKLRCLQDKQLLNKIKFFLDWKILYDESIDLCIDELVFFLAGIKNPNPKLYSFEKK